MNSKPMVSIIVPVYNAEKYLSNCVTSILNQTYENIEIILINDGSTDLSGTICNDIAITDHRIKMIHQLNAGSAHARNTGINRATGNYFQFVDADDAIEPQMTEQLVEAMAENVQLVICGYRSVAMNEITTEYIPSIKGVYQKPAFMQHFGELYMDMLLPSPCNKLYRAEMINSCDIRFTENLTMGEDLLFNLAYINVCTRINVIKHQLYNYAFVPTSITRSFNKDLFENQKLLFEKVKAFLFNEGCYQGENKHFLHVIYATSIVNSLNNIFHRDSGLPSHQRKKQIAAIVFDDDLEKNGPYFEHSTQSRIVGRMINYKSVSGIYWFFTVKRILQYKLPGLFYLLKKINN